MLFHLFQFHEKPLLSVFEFRKPQNELKEDDVHTCVGVYASTFFYSYSSLLMYFTRNDFDFCCFV